MNFKPSDFFIGLMEFFSIFLPGFIVAFFLNAKLTSIFHLSLSNEASLVVYYFVASYILGHFVYAAGAFLLEAVQLFGRADISAIYSKRPVVKKAAEIMDRHLKSISENKNGSNEKIINVEGKILLQKWANTIIQIKHPELLTTVRQHEADAKFFRSFIIVAFLGFFISIFHSEPDVYRWCWSLVAVFSVWLHIYRKYKAILTVSNVIVSMESILEINKSEPSEKNDS